jgi:hypothetical protein
MIRDTLKQEQSMQKGWVQLCIALLCLFVCIFLVSCDSVAQQSLPAAATVAMTAIETTPVPTASAIETGTPEPTWTPVLFGAGTKEANETAVVERLNAIGTEVALTHEPVDTPGPPPVYPTPTLVMGLIPKCANASARGPQCINIWRGVISGQIVQVEGGRESLEDDPTQGLAIVTILSTHEEQVYNTPQKVGVIRVAAVDGARVTFVPVDFRTPQVLLTPWTTATPGTTFVFDLVTRQWISLTPSPTIRTPTPTWSRQALDATTVAVFRALPTLSPNPRVEPTVDAHWRTNQAWDMAARTAVALYPPPSPLEYPELLTPISNEPWSTGIVHKRTTPQGVIYDSRFVGPPCNEVMGTNHWYGQAVGERTHVCAGEDKMRHGTGAIVVEVWYSGAEKPTYGGYYLAPSAHGAVRIQDVVGDQVILVSADNTMFTFDLATRQWLSGTPGPTPSNSASPIPSVSPLPTQQP